MKTRLTITVLAALAALLWPAAADAGRNDLFGQANAAYDRGEFEQAAALYREIIDQDGLSAGLLYNLANCYAATGRTGLAVLNYERALRLAPADADIQANLALVRKDGGLPEVVHPGWQRIAALLPADGWLLLATGGLIVCSVLLLLSLRLTGPGRRLLLFPLLFCLAIIGTGLSAAWIGYQSWQDCVVINPGGRLLISPFAGAESRGPIREGSLVRPLKEHQGYVLVRDRNGRQGWIPREEMACIVPVN